MAQTTSADTGGSGQGFFDRLTTGLKDVAGLAIEWEQAKRIDVETSNSTQNIPGREDQVYTPTKNASVDSLGGGLSRKYGGLTGFQWVAAGAGVTAFALILKRVRVI